MVIPVAYVGSLWRRGNSIENFADKQEAEIEREILLKIKSMNPAQFELFHEKYVNIQKEKMIRDGINSVRHSVRSFVFEGSELLPPGDMGSLRMVEDMSSLQTPGGEQEMNRLQTPSSRGRRNSASRSESVL